MAHKKKLISHDAFETLRRKDVSEAGRELLEAAPLIAEALDTAPLTLASYDAETALFESDEGNFYHAGYRIEGGDITLESFEQIAVNSGDEVSAELKQVQLMLDSLLENNNEGAEAAFNSYLAMPSVRRGLREGISIQGSVTSGNGFKSKARGKRRAGGMASVNKGKRSRARSRRMETPGLIKKKDRIRDRLEKQLGGRQRREGKGKRQIRTTIRLKNEWLSLYENSAGYLASRHHGPVIQQIAVESDDTGTLTGARIPTAAARNEAKMLAWCCKGQEAELKFLRRKAKKLQENKTFAEKIVDAKRVANASDDESLARVLESIAGDFPESMFLSEKEMGVVIKAILESARAKNFDDATCAFLAEGLLRNVHEAQGRRATKLMRLAGVDINEKVEDGYSQFRDTVANVFETQDQNDQAERQLYIDLYEAIRNLHESAREDEDREMCQLTAERLDDLVEVLEGRDEARDSVIEDAAAFLAICLETNLSDEDWNVSNSVHVTSNGDHPQMAKNARQGYAPASDFDGDWGDVAPSSDGKTVGKAGAEEMRWNGFANQDSGFEKGNPYTPKPFGKYTMKGEKGADVDVENGLGHLGGETWPSLNNPYTPKAFKSGEPKMKNSGDTDLVVEK